MQTQTTQLRRCLDARDLRELVACAIVIIVFGIFYFTVYREPISRFGVLIIIGSTIFIAWKLIHTRRTTPPAPPGATTVESLRAELNSVRAQSRLLGSVLWWYVLPPTVGLLIATWGMRANLHAKIPATVVFIAVDVFIWWVNRWARAKQLLPLEAQLEALIHSAETGDPVDETQVSDLRTVAISMAAADQAKPIDFKVAFWQIALFAEIGFVGIWFFLMLSFALDTTAGNPFPSIADFFSRWFSPMHLLWLAPAFLAGLLFTWLLQKGTERAVGISTLGLHLNRGLNLVLWDEIKEVRTFRLLHVRSLWLIRQSGPKMIMPWTSLERHLELKTAVETFAPPNHPIRQYLSLLSAVPRDRR